MKLNLKAKDVQIDGAVIGEVSAEVEVSITEALELVAGIGSMVQEQEKRHQEEVAKRHAQRSEYPPSMQDLMAQARAAQEAAKKPKGEQVPQEFADVMRQAREKTQAHIDQMMEQARQEAAAEEQNKSFYDALVAGAPQIHFDKEVEGIVPSLIAIIKGHNKEQ